MNLWQYTEDLSSNRYSTTLCTKTGETVTRGGIVLARASSSNYNASIRSQLTSLGISLFTQGQQYLVSMYAQALTASEQFIYMRNVVNASTYGHGSKIVTNRVRRLWQVVRGMSATTCAPIIDPTNPAGDVGGDLYWFMGCQTDQAQVDAYLGGFMVEQIDPNYKDGIAVIGDSTMAGASGGKDSPSQASREVPRYLGAYLNVPVYNRAIGGYRLDQLDAAWATQITPVAGVCKYVVIQGGVNDFGQGRTAAQAEASIQSVYAKALADGLIPVFFTCTPSISIATTPSHDAERQAFNAWLKATYPNVIDITSVVEQEPNYLPNKLGWLGDGTHYGQPAAKAIAQYAAQWDWDFVQPSAYTKVATT